jgi:DNA-binding response OmpR family regulator
VSVLKQIVAAQTVAADGATASDHTGRTVALELRAHDDVTRPFDQRGLLARTGHVAADRAMDIALAFRPLPSRQLVARPA